MKGEKGGIENLKIPGDLHRTLKATSSKRGEKLGAYAVRLLRKALAEDSGSASPNGQEGNVASTYPPIGAVDGNSDNRVPFVQSPEIQKWLNLVERAILVADPAWKRMLGSIQFQLLQVAEIADDEQAGGNVDRKATKGTKDPSGHGAGTRRAVSGDRKKAV